MASGVVEDRVHPFTESEFEELYRMHFAHVYNYARARVGPEEGEDVAAECFQAAAIAWRDGSRPEISRAWLMAVAHNKVVDRWRHASVRRAKWHLVRAAVEEADPDGAPGELLGGPTRAAVLAALDALKPNHRALLILHHVDGMPTKAIAEELGMTPAAVDSALGRARRSFRQKYRDPEQIA